MMQADKTISVAAEIFLGIGTPSSLFILPAAV
jgi:hypothetical protein